MNDAIISIIVPCYNSEKYIRETLECLEKQTIDNWECIIVNDGSTDGSLNIIKEFAERDRRYIYIDKKNEGVAIARNTAIYASHGKYIMPLDADDLIHPTFAEKAVKYMEEHEDVTLVNCLVEKFDALNEPFYQAPYIYERFIWTNSLLNTTVFRRADFDKTKGYDPKLTLGEEDRDFWLSILKPDSKVYRIPEVLAYYRIHKGSRNSTYSCSRENLRKIHAYILHKHADKYAPYTDELILLHRDIIEMHTQIRACQTFLKVMEPFRKIARYIRNRIVK